jgi:branched-chain amino acid transport system substrate-binding protein
MSERLDWRVSRRKLLTGSAAAGAGLVGLGIVGCGDDDDSAKKTATGGTTAPATTSGEFKLTGDLNIGMVSSFTGPLATIYAPFSAGAKLAIEEINAKGGIAGAKINFVQADDQSNPANVPAATLGLLDKKVNFCLGPIGSNAIVASDALNKAKIMQFGYSDNPDLANTSKFPYSFRYVWSPEQSSKLIVDWYKKQGWDKVAILAENTVYGQTDAPATEKYMKSIGMTPTLFEYFQPGTADFTPLLRKCEDAKTQAIVWWTQGGPEGVSVIRNIDSLKSKMVLGGIGLFAFGLAGAVSQETLDKTYSFQWKRTTYTDSEPVGAKVKALRDNLAAKGADWLGPTGSGVSPFYDMVYHLKAAIEGAKSTESTAVVKWMEKNPFDGAMANYTGITDKDHTVTDVSQITMAILGSLDQKNLPFYKRAPGL